MIRLETRVTEIQVDQNHPTPEQVMLAPSYKQYDRALSQLTLSLPQITFSHPLIQPTILVFR